MCLLAYLAFVMEVTDFADFAIFWATLRLFSFYGSNNLHIVYFNKVRGLVVDEKKWPREVSANIIFTFLIFSIVFLPISFLVFKSYSLALILYLSSFFFMTIRYIAEYSKINNNLFLSIFIEDILFNILLFVLCLMATQYQNNLFYVVAAVLLALIITAVVGIIMFIRKFDLTPKLSLMNVSEFSKPHFISGLNYSILRGHEVLSNFAIRYLGKLFYGSLFVAYAHVLFQFYNIFSILTISVISGFQSKTTVKYIEKFDGKFIMGSYKRMIKTLLPFIFVLVFVLVVFGHHILQLMFPKYVEYYYMLIWICVAGLIFAFIQPFVFIFIYNNKFKGIKRTNSIQYIVLALLLGAPMLGLHQDIWLFLLISIFVTIQGLIIYLLTKD